MLADRAIAFGNIELLYGHGCGAWANYSRAVIFCEWRRRRADFVAGTISCALSSSGDRPMFCRMTKIRFEVPLTLAQHAWLKQIADEKGTSPRDVVRDLIAEARGRDPNGERNLAGATA